MTAQEVLDGSNADKLLDRLLFTMGCHAGLAVPDAYVPGTGASSTRCASTGPRPSRRPRSPSTSPTPGFGIGDTSSVAYSERLMGLYAKLLDGSLTVGQALAYAKQAYYGSLGAVGVYDLKILQQTAFYGLPFWRCRPRASRRPDGPPPPAPTVPDARPACRR